MVTDLAMKAVSAVREQGRKLMFWSHKPQTGHTPTPELASLMERVPRGVLDFGDAELTPGDQARVERIDAEVRAARASNSRD